MGLEYTSVFTLGRVQELYMSMLTMEFIDRRLSAIARENGIGPSKLARSRKRGKAGLASWHGIPSDCRWSFLCSLLLFAGAREFLLRGCVGHQHHRM